MNPQELVRELNKVSATLDDVKLNLMFSNAPQENRPIEEPQVDDLTLCFAKRGADEYLKPILSYYLPEIRFHWISDKDEMKWHDDGVLPHSLLCPWNFDEWKKRALRQADIPNDFSKQNISDYFSNTFELEYQRARNKGFVDFCKENGFDSSVELSDFTLVYTG